jgi:hypothetical protein
MTAARLGKMPTTPVRRVKLLVEPLGLHHGLGEHAHALAEEVDVAVIDRLGSTETKEG